MKLHPIQIGKIKTENNLFLAPLAGYTNYPFRALCSRFGAGLCFTEMVSAKGLKYGSENTKELLYTTDSEKIKAVQIFGNEPSACRLACESEELAPFDIVDINMGCPVPKIYKNGEGSALLENIPLAERIVKECVKSGKAISVKFRIGVDKNSIVTEEFAKRMEGAGASLLTIHGRTKDMFYSGEVNFFEIEKAKKAVQIPIVANGGVFSVKDGEQLMEKTGADGIAIARAALSNPQLFAEFTGAKKEDLYAMIKRQLVETREVFDERFTTVFMRKMVVFYIKGRRGASSYKERLFACQTPDEVLRLAKEIFTKED